MKQTIDNLNEQLSEAIAWRRKELTHMIQQIESEKDIEGSHYLFLSRAAITLMYAHFEKFIKESTACYIEYINDSDNYALKCRSIKKSILWTNYVSKNPQNNNFKIFSESLDVWDDEKEILNFKIVKNILIKSENINEKKLKNLTKIIGLDLQILDSKSEDAGKKYFFVIDDLVSKRNEVAHGSYLEIEKENIINYIKCFREILDLYKGAIEDKAKNLDSL